MARNAGFQPTVRGAGFSQRIRFSGSTSCRDLYDSRQSRRDARFSPRPVATQLNSSDNGTEESGHMPSTPANKTIVVPALRARTHFGKLLRWVEDERRSLVIEKRGTPRAVLLSIRDYVRLAAPEPEVLSLIGRESESKGTDTLSSREIDRVIQAARARKPKR